MVKLMSGENLISNMANYFDYLSVSSKNTQGMWTSPYIDAWGLGLMITYAIPCISKVNNRCVACSYKVNYQGKIPGT